MILIDTMVISEAWRPKPELSVVEWLDAQALETLHLSAITVAELRFGIATMARRKRRDLMQARLEREILPLFAGRVLAFDLEASHAYATLMAQARAKGKGISAADGYIAATAATHGLIVATRETGPFEAAGLKVINPWKQP